MDEREAKEFEIAAFWGLAQNVAYPLEERLQCAITALEKMSKLVPGWDDGLGD